MGLSNYLPSSRLIQPGVCTSSTRPASPFEGQCIYETDTDNVLYWNGSAWYSAWNTAWGRIAYTESTSTDSTITTSEEIQITQTSFTAVANRRYRIMYVEPNLNHASDVNMTMRIRLTNVTGAVQGATYIFLRAGNFSSTGVLVTYATFSAGSTTLVATLQSGSGTGAANRDSTFKAWISTEDVGPA